MLIYAAGTCSPRTAPELHAEWGLWPWEMQMRIASGRGPWGEIYLRVHVYCGMYSTEQTYPQSTRSCTPAAYEEPASSSSIVSSFGAAAESISSTTAAPSSSMRARAIAV